MRASRMGRGGSEWVVFVYVRTKGKGMEHGEGGGVLLIFVFKRGPLFRLLFDLCSLVELGMFFFLFFSLLFFHCLSYQAR
jgi:hypothetical protein